MLQFKATYQDVCGKPIASGVLRVSDIEEAIDVAVDYCLANRTACGCEFTNAAGFVLRIQFNQARKPLAELRQNSLKKYSRSRAQMSHQLNLFAL